MSNAIFYPLLANNHNPPIKAGRSPEHGTGGMVWMPPSLYVRRHFHQDLFHLLFGYAVEVPDMSGPEEQTVAFPCDLNPDHLRIDHWQWIEIFLN